MCSSPSRAAWALFPWCEGRAGSADRVSDLRVLVEAQAAWTRAVAALREEPELGAIRSVARTFRRRKSWAWVVPLHRVPEFVAAHDLFPRARDRAAGPHRGAFLDLLPRAEASVAAFDELARSLGIHRAPLALSHGDFWASNVCIGPEGFRVLDLDCFSLEPRVTDFARAANVYGSRRTPAECAALFADFRRRARLPLDEASFLPLMMCAHDLYYAVGHVLLFLEDDTAGQARGLRQIPRERDAAGRFRRERDGILRTFGLL